MRAIATTLISLLSFPVLAGGYSVGNGGVLWACFTQPGRVFHAGMLTDLYEARLQL